jgi:hypothetical protein
VIWRLGFIDPRKKRFSFVGRIPFFLALFFFSLIMDYGLYLFLACFEVQIELFDIIIEFLH